MFFPFLFSLQFVVYSGYYYFLTLLFVGVGVYNLTSRGWLKSIRFCCREERPPSLICANDESDVPTSSDAEDDTDCEPSDIKPLIQDEGRPSIMTESLESLDRPV